MKIKYRENISEDETAYIAVLFALALEQEKEKIKKRNILIVCAAGMSSARLLEYQYRQEFKDYIDEIYCCDMYHIDDQDFSRIDYVFSTVPLKKRPPKPVIEVRSFLNQTEISNIKHTLLYGAFSMLAIYYRSELFFDHVHGNSKEEVILNLCNKIREKYPLPEGFYQAVLKREELASTDFGNRVALPHPYEAMTEDTIVCVGILEHPIVWARYEVQVVFLVSVASTENRELQTFYQMTTSLMQDRKAIDELIEHPDFQNFVRLLYQKREG